MNTLCKTLLIGTLLTATTGAAYAQEPSLLQKIKGFFSSGKPTAATTVAAPAPEPKKTTDEPKFDFSEKSIGDASAPIKMLIFTSLTCPHCSGMHLNLLPLLKKEYADTGRAQIILMDFPIDARATTASLVSRCLPADKYFGFVDTLFAHQQQWAVAPNLQEALAPHAKLAGLSEAQMLACATNDAALKEMTRIRNLNAMQYKIHATPTLVVRLGKKSESLIGLPSMQAVQETVNKLSDPNYVPPKPEQPEPHSH